VRGDFVTGLGKVVLLPDSVQHVRSGIHVLIAHFDLFVDVGGGQSVYKALIAARPNDVFHYFLRREKPDTVRPANAVGIPYLTPFLGTKDSLPSSVGHFFHVYLECRNMAASIARHCPGAAFDVIDVPDFSQFGLFLAQTLRDEDIQVGMTALAMHGTLSQAFRGGWPVPADHSRVLAELRMRERLQFRSVDARYAISHPYIREWQRITPLPVNELDPLCVIGIVTPVLPGRSDAPPDLTFVGRLEKWKGPDIFLDLAWCVDPSAYNRLIIAGPDGPNHLGIGSMSFLPSVAAKRGLRPEIVGNLNTRDVGRLYADRALLLLPSRHDTFNLVALEAALRGCPVHVSRHAGVAEWLRGRLPEFPWMVIDIDCGRTAAGIIADTLRNYDDRRAALVEHLSRRPPEADMRGVERIYSPSARLDVVARQVTIEMAARFSTQVRLSGRSVRGELVARTMETTTGAARQLAPFLPQPLRRAVGRFVRRTAEPTMARPRRSFLATVKARAGAASGLSPRAFDQITAARRHEPNRRHMLTANETRAADFRSRLRDLSRRVPNGLVNRVPLFLEMARLERRIGNDLTAATYMLRVMRWLSGDRFGDLPFVAATLRAHDFPREADTAEAMFGPVRHRSDRCFDLVTDSFERNRHNAERSLAVIDDRRGTRTRRICVIVSLYNAADKLPTLLNMLTRQTAAQREELEVVLIDSNSPADEYGAMLRFLETHSLPVVYARSENRETIQAAWNRGIHLARAPYLCFLGADEGLHPDALCQLSAALDSDPSVDWAMADSVVTNVDRAGIYQSDVMSYDRSGYRQDLVYLETCYLSWVGGLYRRSIHERFGYYDESFRASGDTEFKNRVLPHIRSVHVPRTLGVFNNYPEDRTTQSPRAEIEDLRAWYLWRTEGGMRYAFDQRAADDAVALLRTALNYRKSFCGHLSSDFDFANALAVYLSGREDAPDWIQQARQEISGTLAVIRDIEWLPSDIWSRPRGLGVSAWTWRRIRDVRSRALDHQRLMGLSDRPNYEVFNDNRHEQHWWSWSGQ
jgi:glycosyltransferase involved in cell wall biosynthesis